MPWFVNDEEVDDNMIVEEIDRLCGEYEQAFPDQPPEEQQKQLAEWSRENVIERVLLRQAAARDPEPMPAEEIEKAFEELLGQYGGREQFFERNQLDASREPEVRRDVELRLRYERLTKRLTESAPAPTEEEVRQYYDENIETYTAPEMLRAAHIVMHPSAEVAPEDQRKELEGILQQLRAGADFAELAGQHSECPDSGGDLGFFPRGQMVEAFEEVAFNLEVGEISDIFETEFGLHIARVTEKRDSAPHAFEEVSEHIAQDLSQQRGQAAVEAFIDAEKERAVIEERLASVDDLPRRPGS